MRTAISTVVTALAAVLFAILMMGSAAAVFGQTAELAPELFPVFVNVNGITPVALGFLCTTTTLTTNALATYQDAALSVANQNPIRLNAGGQPVNGSSYVSIFLQAATYRFTLYAAGTGNTCNGATVGSQIRQVDGIANLAQLFSLTFATKLDDKVCHASQYSGTTAGAKIVACIAALPATGGTVDARGLEGTQTVSQDMFSGATKPITLLLGFTTFNISVTQNCPAETIIIQGSHSGSNDATPKGTVLHGTSGLVGTPLLVCSDLNSRWSELNDVWVTSSATTGSTIQIANLGMNMKNVFVNATAAVGIEIQNSVGALFTNVHATGVPTGLWINPTGVQDVALNTFINVTGGSGVAATNTGIRIDGYLLAPMNHFIGCNVEGANIGIYSDGAQTGFDDCETEVNTTYGLYDTDRAQSLFLRRKTNDTLRLGSTSSDVMPRTQQINSFVQNTQIIGTLFANGYLSVNGGAVPVDPVDVKGANGLGFALRDYGGTTNALVHCTTFIDAGTRYGACAFARSSDGVTQTFISADPADISKFGTTVNVAAGTSSTPGVASTSFTTTGLSWSAGPVLHFNVNGIDQFQIDTTNSATSSPLFVNMGGTFKELTLGAADSCTAGFRCVRVVN